LTEPVARPVRKKEEMMKLTPTITITKDGKTIAHLTTDSCLSRYGQPVWVVEDESPEQGEAVWMQGENEQPLHVFGVVGGWLVASQSNGLLSGIIWSDGEYWANLIEHRGSKRPVSIADDGSDATYLILSNEVLERMTSSDFQVGGTIDGNSPLGCIFPWDRTEG